MKFVRVLFLFSSCLFILSCGDETADKTTAEHTTDTAVEVLPDGWQTTATELFSINHPKEWTADLEGKMGTKLFLFAKPENAEDRFNENINLMSEKLPNDSIDLNMYMEVSEENISNFIADAKILKSERVTLAGQEYQNVNYQGTQGGMKLWFEQYYTISNGEAFVLTLTCQQDSYKKYEKEGRQILKSFRLFNNP